MKIESILVVDDDPDIRKIAQISLSRIGKWTVHLAGSATSALDLALQLQPNLILLDVMMPEIDGPTILHQVKAHPELQHIPVLFMTAKVLRHEIDSYASMGAIGIIRKPFDPISLPDEIKMLISGVHN